MFDLTLFYPLELLKFDLSLVVKSVLLSILILVPFVAASYLVNSYIKKRNERSMAKSVEDFYNHMYKNDSEFKNKINKVVNEFSANSLGMDYETYVKTQKDVREKNPELYEVLEKFNEKIVRAELKNK